jgi:hypothetical protein
LLILFLFLFIFLSTFSAWLNQSVPKIGVPKAGYPMAITIGNLTIATFGALLATNPIQIILNRLLSSSLKKKGNLLLNSTQKEWISLILVPTLLPDQLSQWSSLASSGLGPGHRARASFIERLARVARQACL